MGALKAALADVPDETIVLAPGSDHSYVPVYTAEVLDVERSMGFQFFEYYGPAGMFEGSEVDKGFVISSE